jgi:hypothetical protein
MSETRKNVVRFNNGRIENNQPIPHILSSYYDKYGQIVDFRQIPLCEEKNGEIVDKVRPDGSVMTYDKSIDFQRNRTIELHPVIHKKVIQAIRNSNKTVSSKKDEGYPKVKNGWIIEHEPFVNINSEYQENQLENDVHYLLRLIKQPDNKDTYHTLCVFMGLLSGQKKDVYNKLSKLALKDNNSKKRFLMHFVTDDQGQVDFENLELTDSVRNQATIKEAIILKVITYEGGLYYFGKKSLGHNSKLIHVEHHDLMGAIQSSIQNARPK